MIRLIRQIDHPSGRGPGNGMYALQKALSALDLPWLAIGGDLLPGEIPWIWCWEDKPLAIRCHIEGRPFILGPCVFFGNADAPGAGHGEKMLIDSPHCVMMFTESRWYADLIEAHRGPRNTAPLHIWPFPIDPQPKGPASPKYDLLIYAKSGYESKGPEPTLVAELQNAYPNNCTIYYGGYHRELLWEKARRSRCCAYLSRSDRGPLALAEILLCGCPAVGVRTGAPWIDESNGRMVESLAIEAMIRGITEAGKIDRESVRRSAVVTFDPTRAAGVVVDLLSSLNS